MRTDRVLRGNKALLFLSLFTHIYIYIYIERERYIYIYIYMCLQNMLFFPVWERGCATRAPSADAGHFSDAPKSQIGPWNNNKNKRKITTTTTTTTTTTMIIQKPLSSDIDFTQLLGRCAIRGFSDGILLETRLLQTRLGRTRGGAFS